MQQEERIVLQVKDNFGMLKALQQYIRKNKLRKRIYIQYHYHGFYPFTADEFILSQIDELILLTTASYRSFKKKINTFPVKVTICHDGVDSSVFKPVSKEQKMILRDKYALSKDALIFVWCSRDRKKKGLDIILEMWSELTGLDKNIHLLVIGLQRDTVIDKVTFLGEIPNKDLTEYYQLSDFYLFPTLCQEGLGLSLIEALKCGSFCIAADNGSVPEVLRDGTYGLLVQKPNVPKEWVSAVLEAIKTYRENDCINPYLDSIPENIYDMEDWYNNYNALTQKAKESFDMRFYI